MKKIIVGFLAVISTCSASFAQDARAKTILAAVSKQYRTYDMIKTGFTYTINNPQAKLNETQSGTLYVRSKTNKYRVILSDQELISNGKMRWTYLKEDKEVQVSDVDNSADAFNPAKIFTIYESGFKYLYTGESKVNGRVHQLIDLTPVDAKRSYFKIRLSVDKLLKQVRGATVFDKNGNRYTYAIKTFTPNVKVDEALFTFDPKKHPGVDVVDLR